MADVGETRAIASPQEVHAATDHQMKKLQTQLTQKEKKKRLGAIGMRGVRGGWRSRGVATDRPGCLPVDARAGYRGWA